ncbi:MAG: hypothetical protein Q4B50_03820 [Bacillota bacterium]|nr:hypothetical protein [Bacillota bacterium]
MKERLEGLGAKKEEPESRISSGKPAQPPKVSRAFIELWLDRFRRLDLSKQSHRKRRIDTFANAIYLFDDKMLIVFN